MTSSAVCRFMTRLLARSGLRDSHSTWTTFWGADQPDKPEYLLRDFDTKFVPEFDAILESEGITVKKVGPLAPNLNARAERWIQSVKRKCLDHFIVFGEDHLRYLVSQYTAYHNR